MITASLQSHRDAETMVKNAIFTLAKPCPDIFMVLKIERILRGEEVDDALDPYFKNSSVRFTLLLSIELIALYFI